MFPYSFGLQHLQPLHHLADLRNHLWPRQQGPYLTRSSTVLPANSECWFSASCSSSELATPAPACFTILPSYTTNPSCPLCFWALRCWLRSALNSSTDSTTLPMPWPRSSTRTPSSP